MERNPYSAPTTPVEDPGRKPPMERPKAITTAIRLVWISFAIGIPFGLYSTWTSDEEGATAAVFATIFLAIFDAIAFGICFWLLDAIGKGKNWARITILVLFLVNLVASLATPAIFAAMGQTMPKATVLEWVVIIVQDGLMIAALVLMFSRAARPWFAFRR